MLRLLLRFSKSAAAWENGDVTEVMKTNFRTPDGGWDLRVSVYEIEAPSEPVLERRIVRVCAEHVASFLRPHRKATPLLDTNGLAPTESTCGRTEFSYANDCHREVVLSDEQDLRAFVEQLRRDRSARAKEVAMSDIRSHVASMHARCEWVDAAARNANVRAWILDAMKTTAR